MGNNTLGRIDARIFYRKTGRAKYISHLDLARCMQRAVKRTGLPVWYTVGFNPRLYLGFALPLPLGQESVCETVDLCLMEDIPFEEVLCRINQALPVGIEGFAIAAPVHKPEAIAWAEYGLRLEADGCAGEVLREKFERFWGQERVEVEKKTKKGSRRIDLKSGIRLLGLEPESGCLCLRIQTEAGTSRNINPTLLTDAFIQAEGLESPCVQVLRQAILMEDGTSFC